jgi:cytochrome c553
VRDNSKDHEEGFHMRFVRRSNMLIVCAVLLVLVLIGSAGCGSDEPDTIAPETPGTEAPAEPDTGDGAEVPDTDADRALVETKCSGCHNLDRVWAASYDAAGWDSTVNRMEANGLQLSDEERAAIVAYLAAQ